MTDTPEPSDRDDFEAWADQHKQRFKYLSGHVMMLMRNAWQAAVDAMLREREGS